MHHFDKDEHLLTVTDLNPADRMNVESAQKFCSERIIKLLESVEESQGTALFLQIMADSIADFDVKMLIPLERVEKLWYAVFIVRIWRNFILKTPALTLKNNFMSSFSYYCIEQNAHSLVLLLTYLKKNSLSHLFVPHLFCSQPCESFFRQLRSSTSTYSTVVNFSTKEILNRISRIHLLSEISNDSKFDYPKSLKSCNVSNLNFEALPNEKEIISTIEKTKIKAIEEARKIGLIKGKKVKDICVCHAPPYIQKFAVARKVHDEIIDFDDKFNELEMKLSGSTLKNYAYKFEENSVPETSSYVEFDCEDWRCVFKKTSVCWFLRKESYKCSSDRNVRVRKFVKTEKAMTIKTKSDKTFKIYKKIVTNKCKKSRRI